MTTTVGLVGTFDVANYGDLLFPLVAQRELAARRPDLDFVWFGPIGASAASWPVVLALGPLRDSRIHRMAEICDAVILGGGDLIRDSDIAVAPSYGMSHGDADVWRPSAWFSSLDRLSALGPAVLWNAVGVAEPPHRDVTAGAEYVTVRDRMSARNLGSSTEVPIVPDTVFTLDRIFPRELLRGVRDRLVGQHRIPAGDFIAVQAASSIAPLIDLDAIDRLSAGRDIVVVEIGPCHGDSRLTQLVRERFGPRAWAVEAPAMLEDIATAIAHASCFIGNSLHGGITALVYDTPFRLYQFDPYSKRQGVLEVVGVGTDHLVLDPGSIPEAIDQPTEWDRRGTMATIDAHFDRLAELIPVTGSTSGLGVSDRPEFVQLALEVPPRPLDLGSEVVTPPLQPPAAPDPIMRTIRELDEARTERSEMPDPALSLLRELGRTRSTPDDFIGAEADVKSLRASAATAEAGWRETLTVVATLEDSLARATQGWGDTAERARLAEERARLSDITVSALDAQLVSRLACWQNEVAGPPVTAQGRTVDAVADYDAWRRVADVTGPAAVRESVKFSILTPVFNPAAELLEACIRSVRAQTYRNWQLLLVDVSDAPHVAPICDRFATIDDRIVIIRSENLGISGNTNLAASEADGDWLALLDHDDELAPHALASFASAIARNGDLGFGYSDEDKIDEQGRHSDPFFKPDWSPDLLRTLNYVTHLQVVRRDVWDRIGGLRPEMDGAQDYDLALRATAVAGGAIHVADILYHWRMHEDSTASDVTVKPHAHRAGRRALEDFVRAHSPGSWIEFGTGPTSHRVRYELRSMPLSIIIPFRDRPDLTQTCLEGIARTGTALPVEVLLVDNRSEEETTEQHIESWLERYAWARLLRYDEPFNFQKLNNWAVEHASGDLLLFLNNDTEPFHEGWVEALAEHAQRPEIGAVGARLFYPNGLVQHAGVVVGIGGYADHPWSGLAPDVWTPAGPSYWTRNFLAVTAACLMVERTKFESVGGFDERFTIGGGDVALGLALHEQGLWNVMTPYARLIHHESPTRGVVVPDSDLVISNERYAPYVGGRDPFYNPNLSLADTSVTIAPRGRDGRPSPGGPR